MKLSSKLWLALVLIATVILGFVWVWAGYGRALFTDPQALGDWLQQWGTWVPLVTISLHIVQVLSAPIPGTAIDTVNGLLFGPWLGTVYSMIGLQIGAFIMLVLVRKFGRPLAERFISPEKLMRFDQRVERQGAVFIFLIFLFPFMPDDIILILAGLTTISLPYLLLISLLGRLPGVFFANWLGSRAPTLSAAEWIAVAVLLVFLGVIFWWKHAILEEKITQYLEKISVWWQNRQK